MSRIGKLPIIVPKDVKIELAENNELSIIFAQALPAGGTSRPHSAASSLALAPEAPPHSQNSAI